MYKASSKAGPSDSDLTFFSMIMANVLSSTFSIFGVGLAIGSVGHMLELCPEHGPLLNKDIGTHSIWIQAM